MSRKRKDTATEDYLFGGFRNNTPRNRKQLYETMFMRTLTEFATNRFKWTGLPDEVDKRFLEMELFRSALVVFFYDDKDYGRYFALRGSGAGRWNMYDNPTTFTVTGNGMINRTLSSGASGDCVPIWANTLRIPDWDLVLLQSSKLAEIERTIEINLQAMRKPFLFLVDDTERVTFQNMWRQLQEGQPAVFGTKGFGDKLDDKVKLFDMKIDKDLVLNLQISKSKIWNETMTYLGIDNANQDKRERLVADEVSANDSQISAARNASLNARQYACEIINKKYKLDIQCEWNSDMDLTMTGGNELALGGISDNSNGIGGVFK